MCGNTGLRIETSFGHPKGAVTSARVKHGRDQLREAALTLAKTWRYRPCLQHGQPAPAVFFEYIVVFPPGQPIKVHVPFPTVHHWNTVKITLDRGAC